MSTEQKKKIVTNRVTRKYGFDSSSSSLNYDVSNRVEGRGRGKTNRRKDNETKNRFDIGASNDDFVEENDKKVWTSWMRKRNENDTMCRTLLIFGFVMAALAAMVIGIALLVERNAFQSTHVVAGIQGPPGKCNLTQSNQTFFIEGNTELGNNLSVGGDFVLGEALTIFLNESIIPEFNH